MTGAPSQAHNPESNKQTAAETHLCMEAGATTPATTAAATPPSGQSNTLQHVLLLKKKNTWTFKSYI